MIQMGCKARTTRKLYTNMGGHRVPIRVGTEVMVGQPANLEGDWYARFPQSEYNTLTVNERYLVAVAEPD